MSLPPGIAEINLNPSPVQRLLNNLLSLVFCFGHRKMNNVAITYLTQAEVKRT